MRRTSLLILLFFFAPSTHATLLNPLEVASIEYAVAHADLVGRGTIVRIDDGHIELRVTETLKGVHHPARVIAIPRTPERDDRTLQAGIYTLRGPRLGPDRIPADRRELGVDILFFARTDGPAAAMPVATVHPIILDGLDAAVSLEFELLREPPAILAAARAALTAPRVPGAAVFRDLFERQPLPDVIEPISPRDVNVWYPDDARVEEALRRLATSTAANIHRRRAAVRSLGDFETPTARATLTSILHNDTTAEPLGTLAGDFTSRRVRFMNPPLPPGVSTLGRRNKWARGPYLLRISAAEALLGGRYHIDDDQIAAAFPNVSFFGPVLQYRAVPASLLLVPPVALILWLIANRRFARPGQRSLSRAAFLFLAAAALLAGTSLLVLASSTHTHTRELMFRIGRSHHSISLHDRAIQYTLLLDWDSPAQPLNPADWMSARRPFYASFVQPPPPPKWQKIPLLGSGPLNRPGFYDYSSVHYGAAPGPTQLPTLWSLDKLAPTQTSSRLGLTHATGALPGPFGLTHRFHFLRVPLYLPVALMVLPALWSLKRPLTRLHRIRHGRCPSCGYDLRHTPTHCPECGHIPDATTSTPSSAQRNSPLPDPAL